MTDADLVVRALVPLAADLIVDAAVAGQDFPLVTSHGPGRLVMPAPSAEDYGPLRAPAGFGRVPRDWGAWSSKHGDIGQLSVPTIGVEVRLQSATLDFPVEYLGNSHARGLAPLEQEIVEWTDRFQEWAQVLALQVLSRLEPSPKTLNAPSVGVLTWVEAAGQASWVDSSQQVLTVMVEGPLSPMSERVADIATIQRMVGLANDPALTPPAAVSLVVAARRAAQRGQWRTALMEMGTALEAVLTSAMPPPANGWETLGPMTARALKLGIALPQDVQAKFVKPRNQAVHQGITPAPGTVVDGLSMMDALILTYHSAYAADPSLPQAHRVQRHDLHIVKPPERAAETTGSSGSSHRDAALRLACRTLGYTGPAAHFGFGWGHRLCARLERLRGPAGTTHNNVS